MSDLHRADTHVLTEYPKYIEDEKGKPKLMADEEAFFDYENQIEIQKMTTELKEVYGKPVDLRKFRGAAGFGTLKAYYESVIERETRPETAGE